MMLTSLRIHSLRNLHDLHFDPHPHLNLICGANGSGKTSFLEAIHLLGTSHSFRTRETIPLVTHGQQQCMLYAQTSDFSTLSVSKSIRHPTIVKINGHSCASSSELAKRMPIQLFYQDVFHIIDAGPSVRRSVLDWGLFHVEPVYHRLLKDYKHALKQRNALLKQQASIEHFVPWNDALNALAECIHSYRLEYIKALNVAFKDVFAQFSSLDVHVDYYKGWDRRSEGKSLAEVLHHHWIRDKQQHFTRYGIHHADLIITTNEASAKHTLSRGQQKLVCFAIKLAQTRLLKQTCVYLMDDVHAELDARHYQKLMDYIHQVKGQFFITAHDSEMASASLNSDMLRVLYLESCFT